VAITVGSRPAVDTGLGSQHGRQAAAKTDSPADFMSEIPMLQQEARNNAEAQEGLAAFKGGGEMR
jgi:hypothetical protein